MLYLVVYLLEVEAELLELFGDGCVCNGAAQEKRQDYLTGLLLFCHKQPELFFV